MASFFNDLASFTIPWDGERRWESLERDFQISATCTSLGCVNLSVILQRRMGAREEWQVSADLAYELGLLPVLARAAGQFFGVAEDLSGSDD